MLSDPFADAVFNSVIQGIYVRSRVQGCLEQGESFCAACKALTPAQVEGASLPLSSSIWPGVLLLVRARTCLSRPKGPMVMVPSCHRELLF